MSILSLPRRAPDEPDFSVPGLESATMARRSELESLLPFDVPSPEVDIPPAEQETPSSGVDSRDLHAAPAPREDGSSAIPPLPAAIAELEQLLRQGRSGQSLLGLRRYLERADEIGCPTPQSRANWVAALRRAVQAAVASEHLEVARDLLSDRLFPWLRGEHWRKFRGDVSEHFVRLILLEMRLGRETQAIALFEKARNLVTLNQSVRWELAMAGLRLQCAELSIASLYIGLLRPLGHEDRINPPEGRFLNDELVRQILTLLRRAIRIDLIHPAETQLPLVRKLNDELWNCRTSAWCAAHRAIAAVRQGQLPRAREERRQAVELEEADGETLRLLGVVSYCCQAWADAQDLFARCPQDQDANGRTALYQAMTQINQILAGTVKSAEKADFRQVLEAAVTIIESFAGDPGELLDAEWVRGSACVLLGRDQESLLAFRAAPLSRIAWRYIQLEFEARMRLGLGDQAAERLRQLEVQVPGGAPMIRLLSARAALTRFAFGEARGDLVSIPEIPLDDDPAGHDLQVVRFCLQWELQLHASTAIPQIPPLPVSAEETCASLVAWHARLLARWHIERGEMDLAHRLIEDPLQWLGPQQEVQRLVATRMALTGMNEDLAETTFEHLACVPAAQLADRLLWGLWLCGRNDHARARTVLEPLRDRLAGCLEWRLAMAEVALTDGGNLEAARQFLNPGGDSPDVVEPAHWLTPPRVVTFRPWQRRLPITTWGHPLQVSMHRIADMLHGANLLMRADRVEAGMAVIQLVKDLLGDEQPLLLPQLGAVYRHACREELSRSRYEQACRLHTLATEHEAADPDFAETLAGAIEGLEAIPPDAVVEVLAAWTEVQQDIASVEDGPVVQSVKRCLFIDEVTPGSPSELERRRDWSQRFSDARSDWDWPRRNLSRHAARTGRHQEVMAFVDSLALPLAEDHILRGRSAWALDRFADAHTSFARAVEAGDKLPETLAWRGCSLAAASLAALADGQATLEEDAVDSLLDELQFLECPSDVQPQVRVWRGAVQIAACRSAAALESLELTEAAVPEALQTSWRILRGLALLIDGRPREAIAEWKLDAESPDADRLEPSLSLLVEWNYSAGGEPNALRKRLGELRRMGTRNAAFHLVGAHAALRIGDAERAETHLAGVAESEPLPVLLAPLGRWLDAERRLIEARLAMHRGRLQEAESLLESLEASVPWSHSPRFFRALTLLHAGRLDQGEMLLAELAKGNCWSADVQAQLALVFARSGRLKEADRSVQQSLRDAPGNPFALLAKAELQERTGGVEAARSTYCQLLDRSPQDVPRTLRSAVWLARGRLEIRANNPRQAEECFRATLDATPHGAVAKRRLALLLAVYANDPQRCAEAIALLKECLQQDPDSCQTRLAAAVVEHRRGDAKAASEHLEILIGSAGFEEWPGEMRRQLLRWAVAVHAAQRRFGAAIAAIERIDGEAPEFTELLNRCRLLEAVQLLQRVPIGKDDIEQAYAMAAEVAAVHPQDGLALLLVTICCVLAGESRSSRMPQLAEELAATEFDNDDQTLLAALTCHLAGQPNSLQRVESLISGDSPNPQLQAALRLVIASQNREVPTLVQHAEEMLAGDGQSAGARPYDLDDLILLAALHRLRTQSPQAALSLLDRWHAGGRGVATTRTLHSQLLARQAANSLRHSELGTACELLMRAVQILPSSGTASPAAPSQRREPSMPAEIPLMPMEP